MQVTADTARKAAELAARQSYGKLISILASSSRDIAMAEDALADALQKALSSWPVRGIPDRPEAWLLTTARRELGHHRRHRAVISASEPLLMMLEDEKLASGMDDSFPDDLLKLLFVCAHPAIDQAVQAPLMLQTVLGMDAARIASSFLVEPSTMSQRLVRAKAKIRDAGIAFKIPEQNDLAPRVDAVLQAIYAAFGTGWDELLTEGSPLVTLSSEAIWLARVLNHLLPDQPEVKGLLALMLYCDSRKAARLDTTGRFVPLRDQDSRRWSRDQIIEAEHHLTLASRFTQPGRFQIEAAIQSLHTQRALTDSKNDDALIALYEWLTRLSPTVGAIVAMAAALTEADRHESALSLLEDLAPRAQSYAPFWTVRAETLVRLGRLSDAEAAFMKAIKFSRPGASRTYLLGRHAACSTC